MHHFSCIQSQTWLTQSQGCSALLNAHVQLFSLLLLNVLPSNKVINLGNPKHKCLIHESTAQFIERILCVPLLTFGHDETKTTVTWSVIEALGVFKHSSAGQMFSEKCSPVYRGIAVAHNAWLKGVYKVMSTNTATYPIMHCTQNQRRWLSQAFF